MNIVTGSSGGLGKSVYNLFVKNSLPVVGVDINKSETCDLILDLSKNNFEDLENTLGVIYIVRDPRNVVLSYARHLKKSPQETVKFMTKGKANDMFLMGNWAENYISWKLHY